MKGSLYDINKCVYGVDTMISGFLFSPPEFIDPNILCIVVARWLIYEAQGDIVRVLYSLARWLPHVQATDALEIRRF
jgi:hypothetical protein